MENKQSICLITGASSGIGLAIAKALQKDNHKLIITARREERMKELKSSFADIVKGDLTSYDFQDSLVEFVFKKYGKCDYLFNCAGSMAVGSIEEIDIEKMTSMLRLNVEATVRLTYLILRRFKQQGSGHIINISSVLGTKIRPTAGAYAASKFAMEALSEALRMELAGSDIKISCIEPGLVITELHNDWAIHPKDSMNIKDPLQPIDIVDMVKFIMNQPSHIRIPRLMILPKDHVI